MKINATHYGTMFGVPVWIDMTNPNIPEIEVKHRWMEWVLDVMEFMFGLFVLLNTLINKNYEPMYPIHTKGVVNG